MKNNDDSVYTEAINNDDSVYIEEIITHIALYPLQIHKFAINSFVK